MITPETIEKLNRIYEHFGALTQLEKLEEECHEFLRATNKRDIIEEIADIFILSAQHFLISPEIQKQVAYKITRTLQRIADGYYDNGEKRNT